MDLLFLPHDRVGRKTFRYALTVVDVASSYKEAEPLSSKTAAEEADALSRIYRRGPLKWPKLLHVDPGQEFMGAVSQVLAKHGFCSTWSCWYPSGSGHCRTLQSDASIWCTSLPRRCGSQRARGPQWVKRLPAVVAALNGEVTRLTDKKPRDAIRAGRVAQKPSLPADRPVWLQEQKLPSGVGVRYLYQPGELEGECRGATGPVWSLEVYRLGRSVSKHDESVVYYLEDGPQRGFVREELLVVPPDTQQPPDGVLKRWAQRLPFFGCTRGWSAWCYRGRGVWNCPGGQR